MINGKWRVVPEGIARISGEDLGCGIALPGERGVE